MTTNDTSHTESATLDHLFKCLSHPTRRRILTTLATENPSEEEEFEVSDFEIADGELERFETQLYHQHFPSLAEGGYIAWDRNTDTVTRGPNFGEVRPLIKLMNNHEDELPEDWP
ncbi:DUF7344 domain-containing protein [Haloarcula nitratireducens]|uniref:Transcriptional regulator n=1 Tax=Haloarcula nitratireducens TaxID=2487749 RepID=A0AAW4P6T6_9EURY|nr:transcriptional regulator [Halomicroarcula nitratireducens]MBX0293566.1 transcriptional regulator [Halomicroarcula nitratireducens]